MKFNKIYDKIILEFGSCEYAGTDKCTENDKEYWDATDYAIFLNMLKNHRRI